MDKTEWLNATDPMEMVHLLEKRGRFSERKARLFAVAVCRRIWDMLSDERSKRAVEVAERFADGLASWEELETAHSAAYLSCMELPVWEWAMEAAQVAEDASSPTAIDVAFTTTLNARQARSTAGNQEWNSEHWDAEEQAQCHHLRDIFGNPFRAPPALAPGVLAWNGGCISKLAAGVYELRSLPSGHLDADRLAVLADALEEAGFADQELMGHLRGPAVHVRGCWAIDCLSGRE